MCGGGEGTKMGRCRQTAIGYAQGISARLSGLFLGSFIKGFVSIVG